MAVSIACLALGGAVAADAQSKKPAKTAADEAAAPKREIPPAEVRAQRMTDRMKEQVGLTEEQVPRVAEINLNAAKQVDEIRNDPGGTRDERSGRMRAAQEQRDRELKKMLTNEQWVKYKQLQDELKSSIRERSREFRRQGNGDSSGETIK